MRDLAEQFEQVSPEQRQITMLPLVIDLDGGLLPADFVRDTVIAASDGQHPLFANAAGTLSQSQLDLVREYPGLADFDYARLPYREGVVERARQARADGTAVYLITAADQRLALGIASHLGLFKGVISSTVDRPLTDQTKADVLIDEFGPKAFEYIGATGCDQRIINAAPRASVISASHHRKTVDAEVIQGFGNGTLGVWLNALRMHQWTKNALVFIPLLTSHQFSLENCLHAALAFIAFSLCASAAYLLNDLVDLDADRAHPHKRLRPIASGRLSAKAARTAIPILLGASCITALAVSPAFAGILLGYFALTNAYTFYLKRQVIVDIVVLASLYTLRIVAGAVAIQVVLSEWLLIFSIFIFTSLALIKRYSELGLRLDSSLPDPANRDYRVSDMQIVGTLAAASGMNAITIISLYLSSPAVLALYHKPAFLWLLDPLLVYWIARALIMSHRREMNHDPVVFALSDGPSRIAALLMVIVVLVAI